MNQVEIKRKQIQFVSYMIGLINIWIFGKIIGDSGVAYLAAALEAFVILWTLTGSKIPDALGRMLRSRNNKGQYKNADKMKRNIMIQQCVIGLLGTLLFFGGSGLFAEKIFRVPQSRFLMMLLAPVVFIRAISNVLLGYFQGEGSELPTAVSGVLRQIFLLGFGLIFCNMLGKYGEKVSALLGQEAFTYMYGGLGIVVAILLTELLIVLFLVLIYKGSSRTRNKRDTDGMKATDSFIGHAKGLYRNKGGKILLGLLESLPLWLGLIFYQKSVSDVSVAVGSYGVYFGKYLVLCGLVILGISMILISVNARVASSVRKDEQRYAKGIFQSGLRIGMIHALFFTVFTAIMSDQLAGIFGGSGSAELAKMLSLGSVIILCTVLAYYFSRMMMLISKDYFVYIAAGIGDVAFIISAVIMLNAGKMGILSLVCAGMIGVAVYAVLSGVLVCKVLHTGIDWLHTFAIPAGSACIMGLLGLLLGKAFTPHLGNLVTIIVCLILGCTVYWGLLLLLRCFREQELDNIPGGRIIHMIGQMLRVF